MTDQELIYRQLITINFSHNKPIFRAHIGTTVFVDNDGQDIDFDIYEYRVVKRKTHILTH